ncbi:Major facilitator superfamily transporter [Colletotrichum higginsianum IMI 349063]|uniref:Major facilitator superfamily transporter n=2 Tax=Colletotrichum higginsianum TaxID=80884 RepID=A0A1B7YDR1_COLHI|nr:Major facilitator superfamily transporter [Colletotrichum higginsianum IMI 349063]OBR10197.1 Major facilitator superfamily transporter [Colletotrichum higginsianum IMI 349063]TID07657.1 putative transporter [Colletotrichum higginsianum]
MPHTRFAEEPPQVINDADLQVANEKLEPQNDGTLNGDASTSEQTSSKELERDVNHLDRQADGLANGSGAKLEKLGTYDKYEITEDDCYDELGFSFPKWKKWYILTIIFWVQVSMNFNTSLYSNAIAGISDEFSVSAQAGRCGAMIFLVLYAFGCELWAPWSEEFGRWPVLQLSLLLVNIWQLPVALAPNFASIMVGRALGGLSSAGGSVTLGMIADMFESDKQQYAVAYVVFSSVGGSVLGPIVGGFTEAYLHWRWSIWVQLIFGVAVQALHFFTVPETRTTIMMNRIAKRRRKEGNPNIWGPDELVPFKDRFSAKEILSTWVRPFKMFLTEPIVLVLSLLSGFSDALIFMFIQSFVLVYGQWNFTTVQVGLAFIPIGIGYVLAWLLFIPAIKRNIKERRAKPNDDRAQYESRLWFLLYTAPCLPIGLIGFAWTIQGPPIHWIGSMVFAAIVGIANYAIYMATIDYMICAYGPYSASATGGNGWARDFLAGVLTVPATPFFTNIGADSGKNLEYACTILFCISFALVIAVYVIYWKGPALRARSPFAQKLAGARDDVGGRRVSYAPGDRQATAASGNDQPDRPVYQRSYSQQSRFFGENRVTPRGTPRGTPSASRANSFIGTGRLAAK